MAWIVARQSTECQADTQWYVCTRGPFRGCCSIDPCTSGICPDENSNQLAPSSDNETSTTTRTTRTTGTTTRTTTATATSTTTRTRTRSTGTSTATTTTSPVSSTTTSRDTGAPTSSVSTTASTQTSATASSTTSETIDARPTAAADVVAPSQHSTNTAMIGGIIGGVVFLLVLAIIAFLLYRLKKKRGSRFSLVRWRCPRTDSEEAKLEEGDIASMVQSQAQPPTATVDRAVTDLPNNQSLSTPGEPSPAISPLKPHELNSPQTGSVISPNMTPQSRQPPDSSLNIDCPTPVIPSYPAAIHPAFRQQPDHIPDQPTPISSTKVITKDSPIKVPPQNTPQELYDTGFWRRRQELPAASSRELINVPFIERLRQKQQKQLISSSNPSTPIVTSDGAVLSANFNEPPNAPDSHAMSFMNYDSSTPGETRPPSFRSEWRGSMMKEKVLEKFRKKS